MVPTPSGPSGIDVEALLDEGAWVRALAQRLVGASDADDLAQDTFVAALEHAPRDPLHRRSWLARVTTNFARLKRRGDAHRAQREMRASHPEAQPSASETLERLEAQRALVDALRALDEPYRTTVMRRYFDNESAADIARAENVPAATVRWRLMRGVDELRAKLDQRYGDRASWSIAFLPLMRHHAALPAAVAGTSAATITGVLVMNALSRTALVAALVVSGSLGIWLVTRTETPLEGLDIARGNAGAGLEAPKVDAPPPQELAAPKAPTEVRAAVPATNVPDAAAPAIPSTTCRIDGRFVDAAGRAIEGVKIVDPVWPEHPVVKSDEHGSFVLEVPLAPSKGTMHIEAQCAGWATFYGNFAPRPGQTQHMGDIVLEPGGAVAGVVLGPDGAPAGNAQVMATDPQIEDLERQRRQGPGDVRVPNTTSGVDGAFRIEGVPAKMVRAWAHVDGMRWAISDPIDVPAVGVRAGVVLNLEPLAPDDRIEGIVLDPTGKPLGGVSVSFSCTAAGNSWSSGTRSRADGHFQILVMRKVKHDLSVRDQEGRWSAIGLDGVEPGTLDVVLKFHEPRRLDLVVTDEKGAPLEEFGAKLTKPNGYENHWTSRPKPHEDGRISIPIPDAPFVVVAWAHGREEVKSIVYESSGAPARVDMVLHALPGVRGRVLVDGKPVSGARVELHDLGSWTDIRMEKDGWLTRINPNVMEHETSDDTGAYDITVRKAGRYVVVCEATGYARALSGTIDVDPKVGLSGLDMNLGKGGAIEGHVLVPDGRDPGGIIVGITRYDLAPRTVRTTSDGAFRFEGLTPGDWRVQRVAADVDPNQGGTSFSTAKTEILYPTDCVVDEGQTTRFDLDLRHSFDVVLVGHVSVNGAPAAGWSVSVWPDATSAHSATLPGGTVDGSGTVRIVMPHPGKVRIQLLPHVEGTSVEFDQVMELNPGENPWIVDVLAGSLEGQTASGAGTALSYEWKESGPLTCTARFVVDAEGRFRLPVVPTGSGQLNVEVGNQSTETRMVDVKQGEAAVVDLP